MRSCPFAAALLGASIILSLSFVPGRANATPAEPALCSTRVVLPDSTLELVFIDPPCTSSFRLHPELNELQAVGSPDSYPGSGLYELGKPDSPIWSPGPEAASLRSLHPRYILAISPDGRYLVSQYNGPMFFDRGRLIKVKSYFVIQRRRERRIHLSPTSSPTSGGAFGMPWLQ